MKSQLSAKKNGSLKPTKSGAVSGPTEMAASSPGAAMQIQRILVPTDFSRASEKALLYAANFTKSFGAKLSLLHVVEPAGPADFASSFPLAMENSKLKTEFRKRMEKMLRNAGIERDSVDKLLIRYGRAYHEIADAARELESDLIIISTHGYTGLKHILLGSATEKVVRHAPCPVLVVRLEEHEFCAEIKKQPSTELTL